MEKVVKSTFVTLILSVMSLSIEATPNDVPVGKIQDEFMVTPMGQANYEIPIPALPGTGGMTPKLSVCYNSSTKSALFGYGFDLKGLSIISRVPRNKYNDGIAGVVDFTTNDRYALDGARLIQTDSTATTRIFSTENESYSRIVLYGAYENPDSFTVQTKDGLKYLYLPNLKILNPSSNEVSLFWMLTRVTDTNGNYFMVSYIGDNQHQEIYPLRIDYTGNAAASLQPYASVRFNYEPTPDSARTYIHGKMVRRTKCINRISLYSGESLMKKFEFSYSYTNNKKQLTQVKETAADETALKPTTFQWSNTENLTFQQACYNQTSLIHKAKLTIGDYNGDGKADIFATPEDDDAGWNGWRLFLSTGSNMTYQTSGNFGTVLEAVSGDYNGDGLDDIAMLQKIGYEYNTYYCLSTGNDFQSAQNVFSSTAKYSIQTVETNGDGAADLFLWFENSSSYWLIYSSAGALVFPLTPRTSGNSPIDWDEVEFGDFNGDGLTDVYNAGENGAYIMCSDGTGQLTTAQDIDCYRYDQKAFGDFNGDGKTDYLRTYGNGIQLCNWILYASNGVDIKWDDYWDNMENVGNMHLFVTDINGDGFDDCIGIKKTNNNNMTSPTIWLNDGTGHNFTSSTGGVGVYALDKWNIYIADFNGDGKGDMLCTSRWANNNNWNGFQLFLMPKTNHLLLSKITDGMGNVTEITYKYMSDASVHTRGTTSDYPLSSFSTSWPVVSQVKTPNGIGGKATKTYSYENALIHRKGRGVLGFEKVIVTEDSTNITTTTEYSVDQLRYVAVPTHSQTKIGSRIISETETEYSFSGNLYGVFSCHPSSITEWKYEYTSGDLLSETTTTYSYDSYGNVTYMQSVIGDLTTTTMNTYTNDTGRWLLGRLTSTLVSKSGSPFTEYRRAQFTYHPITGLLMSETTEPYNQTLGFTKTYQRDVFGNITQSTTTPNSSLYSSRTDYTSYDAKGRYITSYSNSLNHTCYNTIDDDLGLLAESEDANGVITTYDYDSFGRQKLVSTPLSQDSIFMGWSTGQTDAPANSIYYVRTKNTGSPYKKEFFDCLGRTVRTVTENAFDSKIYTDIIYNNKGQVTKVSEPYFPGSTIYWTQNEYDDAGRIIRQTTPAGAMTTTAYNGYSTTVTDALGHQTVRTIDQYGNLVQSIDNEGGTIDYQYDRNGRCILVTGPRTTVRMEYDLMGNRTMLDDPDLGQVTSAYNAFGELTSQTDSRGTTTWQYDQLGRVISEQRPDVTVTSVYDTNYIGLLTSATTSDGNSVSYQYDAYGRVTQQTDVIGNSTFTTQTSYNSLNKVDVLTYPSGLRVKHQYATNGLLKAVKNASTNANFWQLTQQDARGNVTKETFGNGLVTTNTYNAATGYLTGISTPGIQNWTYQYNLVGNLTQRKDNAKNLTETFDYDTLDRLVNVRKNGLVTQQLTYDAAGNILSKTGVGTNFTYQDGTNRLVSYDSDGYDPVYWDSIHYTSFHKISYVSQGNKMLRLTYGPLKTRVKANQGVGMIGTEKYYVGNLYEETFQINEPTRKVCYIFAAGKAVAIYETLDDAASVRYLHHDHLGSIQAYSDEQGNLAQELSYDAWGRRRNPTTWAYYTAISDANAWHERGFGGHEHIDIFEMVNMDGRMYDPVLGRFLSADPFVQAPDFTQGLNRYSYCLNNPLSLIDPSGYSWLSDNWKSLVSAAVGIAVGVLTGNAVAGIKGLGSLTGLVVSVAGGAAGGAAGALTASLLNGSNIGEIAKNTLTGAFWGGVSAFLTYGAGDGAFLEKLFKHTFSQGWLEGVQGGNMFHGFLMGAVSGTGGHYIHNNLQSLGKIGEISANAVLSGTVSELGGGKFANGAVTGAFHVMFNDMMHDMRQKKQIKKLLKAFPEFKVLWENYPHDINGKHAHPSKDPYKNQCAIRLAYALKKSGIDLSNYNMGPVTTEGYPRGAKSLADWISSEFGKPTITYKDTYDFLNKNSKTGIIFLKGPQNSADHIDLWNGEKSGSGIYQSVEVWFWEIK